MSTCVTNNDRAALSLAARSQSTSSLEPRRPNAWTVTKEKRHGRRLGGQKHGAGLHGRQVWGGVLLGHDVTEPRSHLGGVR
jgi:hypothetical protein